MQVLFDYAELFLGIALAVTGLVAGRWIERRHYASIRLRERQLAASTGARSEDVIASERAFLPALLEAFELLLSRIGREFEWQPALAVRVVILTYERSFESWILSGGSESSFSESSYIKNTLPALLLGVSRRRQ